MPDLLPVDVLIEGGSIITMAPSRRIVRDGAIAVNGDRIVAVGKRDACAPGIAAGASSTPATTSSPRAR